ncbi:MAG: hypothetical protein EXR75_07700 [Myxococcales bacterium]|nr:hypothetical protein [Myxococcales bacterium]
MNATTQHVAECPDLGPECQGPVPPVPFRHHIAQTMAEAALDASYGIDSWLAVDLRVPLRIVDTRPTYSELDGTPKLVPDDIHHHDATRVGVGDPWLVGRVGATRGPLLLGARLGATVPLGDTGPDPYELGRRGISHEHLQLGTGTVMPIVGGGLSVSLSPFQLGLGALRIFSLYENAEGYRAASRSFVSTSASVALLDGVVRPSLSFDWTHESEELWDGGLGDEGPTARSELVLGGAVAWRFYDPWTLEAGVRTRVAKLTSAASFDYPALFQLSVSTHFDLAE